MSTRIVAALLLGLAATPALAQEAPRFAVTGIIRQVNASTITVANAQGAEQSFTLAPQLRIFRVVPASLADIRPQDFVASAAMRGSDGKLHSTELRIFPDSMRGLGEGQHPMHDARQQTMTNATVTGTVLRHGSNDLQVSFAGGSSELVVDPGVPVSRIEPVDRAALQPGQRVRVAGRRDGTAANATSIALQ